MSLLTLAEARALISTGLGDADFQGVIDREEAWLARRIGVLIGTRTQTFHVRDSDADDPLWLRRPTSAVSVTDGGIALAGSDVRLLRDGTVVEKTTGSWTGPVDVAYAPDDTEEVRRVIVELIRFAVVSSPYASESIGDYSYSRATASGSAATPSREALVRDLVPRRGPGTIRLRSPYGSERVGAVIS